MFTLSRKYVGGGGERAGDGRTNRTENDKKSFSREHKKATEALDNLLHFSPKKDAFRHTFYDPKRNFSGESGSTNVPEWPFENDSASRQGWVFCSMMRYRKTILATGWIPNGLRNYQNMWRA